MINHQTDLLDTSITTGITADTQSGPFEAKGTGPSKEYLVGTDGAMLEKPFNGENTLNEPVLVTIVTSSAKGRLEIST